MLTEFCWLEISLCPNYIQENQDLLIVLVDRLLNIRETGNLKHIYKNELNKACFAHDAAYSANKALTKRTISDKILKDRADEIAINPKCNGYQRRLLSMVYNCFAKKQDRER